MTFQWKSVKNPREDKMAHCIYLLEIHENVLKEQYGLNHIVFFVFFAVSQF